MITFMPPVKTKKELPKVGNNFNHIHLNLKNYCMYLSDNNKWNNIGKAKDFFKYYYLLKGRI